MGKPEIKIKKENVGKFNKYCKNKGYNSVTRECEEEGLAPKFGSIRKMAQFSKNSRKFASRRKNG